VRLIERVKQDLDPYAVVEQFQDGGASLIMVLAPKRARGSERWSRGNKEGTEAGRFR